MALIPELFPNGLIDDLGLDLNLGVGPKKRKSAYPPLPPEEENAILEGALNLGKGGLQLLGSGLETLNAPGAYIRGALGGQIGEQISGRDMLENWGLIGPNTDQGWIPDAGDLAGFAADLVTDPLSYLTGGAAAGGKALQIAKKAGLATKGAKRFGSLRGALKESVASTGSRDSVRAAIRAARASGVKHIKEVADEPMGGLFGLTSGPMGWIGGPGAGQAIVPGIASGRAALKVQQGLDTVLGAIGKTKPAVFAKGLFDHTSMGQFTPEGQMAGEFATEARRPAMAKADLAARKAADDIDEIHSAIKAAYPDAQWGDDSSNLIRSVAQLAGEVRKGGVPDIEHSLGQILPGQTISPELKQKMLGAVKGMVDTKDQLANRIVSKGGKLQMMFNDPSATDFGQFPRNWEIPKDPKELERFKALRTTFDSAIARNPAIRYLPANTVNAMIRDPDVAAALSTETATSIYDVLMSKYGDDLNRAAQAATLKETEQTAAKVAKVPTMITSDMKRQLRELGIDTPAIRNMTPQQAWDAINSAAGPVKQTTAENIIDALEEWLTAKGGKGGFSEDAVANYAKYMSGGHLVDANLDAIHKMFSQNLVPGGVPIEQAFKGAGLTDDAVAHFGKTFGAPQAGMGVSPQAVNAAKSFFEKTGNAGFMKAVADAAGKMNEVIKRHLTLPFPSFLARNVASAHVFNLVMSGELHLKDVPAYFRNAWELTKALKNPGEHKQLLNEMAAWGVIPKDMESLGVSLGVGRGAALPNPISAGGMKQNFSNALENARLRGNDTFSWTGKIPGYKKAKTALNVPTEMGGQLNAQAEFLNRGTMYKTLRDKGYSPEAASRITRELQVAYEEVTPFEKNVMKNLVPFYTYAKKTIPLMFRQIAERPGGGTAQLIRLSNLGREEGDFVPGYVGEGMSVPVGEGKYLSQLGLPTDQLGELFATGPTTMGTMKRTLQKVGSMLTPPLKGAIELGTGTNLFTGKPLTDLYQYPTSSPLANALIGDSPLSRYVTTARQIGDTRKSALAKAANLTTGLRITDVSGGLEGQREHAAKTIFQEVLREQPGIGQVADLYVKPGTQLTPEAEKMYRAYRGVVQRQVKAKKKRKKQGSGAQS